MPKHPCECCGYRTLDQPSGGTYQICPVCFWEDDRFPNEPCSIVDSNGITLGEAQENFASFAAVSRDVIEDVRKPYPGESRDPSWRPIAGQRENNRKIVIADIENAFHGVTREGGVSLHETIGLDHYFTGESLQVYRQMDSDRKWDEVRHEDLAIVCGIGGICFFDNIGWRYHLPAYMTWWLSTGEQSESVAADSLLFSLGYCDVEKYKCLNQTQAKATAGFLEHVMKFGRDSSDRDDARKALKSYWTKFL